MKIQAPIRKVLANATIGMAAIVLQPMNACADIVPGTVTTDLFDSSQGTKVTANDVISTTEVINAFRTSGGFEDGHTLMRNGGLNSVSFIEFETLKEVAIRGVRLFAHNDGAANAYRRAMSHFTLLADRDGDGTYEFTVADSAINVNYAKQLENKATDPTNLDLTLLTSGVVRAKYWRLEVTQGTDVQPYEGARLVELDAIAADTDSCDIVPGISSQDPFDVNMGTVVVDSDVIIDPENAFSTCRGFENGHTLMRNGGQNSVSYIDFKTRHRVSIEGIRLFAHNDGASLSFRRAMSNFRLLADLDNNGDYESVVVDKPINVDYAQQERNVASDPADLNMTVMLGGVVAAQNWRLEVTQGTDVQPYEGVRIVELDAIASTNVAADADMPANSDKENAESASNAESTTNAGNDNNNADGSGGGGSLGLWGLIPLLLPMVRARRFS